jgi:hypothetical protein
MPSNVFTATVTVDETTNEVRVRPDPLPASGSDELLVFKLLTGGWSFPDSGALTVAAGGSDFPYASWTINPQLAALFDADGTVADYGYTVTVQHTSGTVLKHDPTIKNQG